MKHAFIFGTNIFLSEHNTVSYAGNGKKTEFLKILSFYRHPKGSPEQALTIDADIFLPDNQAIKIINNQVQTGTDVQIVAENNRVRLYRSGFEQPVLDVYQLDEHEYAGLSSNITIEIETQQPDAVLTIKGNFRVDGAHIQIENEKLFVNAESYANGVANPHLGVTLSSDGQSY